MPAYYAHYTEPVASDISAKQEYLLYRNVLTKQILPRPKMNSVALKTVLYTRSEGLQVLNRTIGRP